MREVNTEAENLVRVIFKKFKRKKGHSTLVALGHGEMQEVMAGILWWFSD